MQIPYKITTIQPESNFDRALENGLLNYTTILARILNDGLIFEDNFNCDIISVSMEGADVEKAISHTIARVPSGYIVISRTNAGVIYNGGTTWTTTHIYLKSTVANNTIKIIVF